MTEETFVKPNLTRLYSNCRMTDRSLVLVEGKDDIPFYDKIASYSSKKTKTVAIENIEGYSEGCEQVIKATENFQDKLEEEEINKKHFLAIIDADVRRFRGEYNELIGLFQLKCYSYESHFITNTNIKEILIEVTSASGELVDNSVLSFIYNNFENKAHQALYLFSLEALRNATETEYSGIIGYCKIPGTEKKVTLDFLLKCENIKSQIAQKASVLTSFSGSKNITTSFDDLKRICKGKWLHHFYIKHLIEQIKKLPIACKDSEVSQCQYCKTGAFDKCLYKLRFNIQDDLLKELSLNKPDYQELEYLIERFKLLN